MRALVRAAALAASVIAVGAGCGNADDDPTVSAPSSSAMSATVSPSPSSSVSPSPSVSPSESSSASPSRGEVTVRYGGLLDLPPKLTFTAVKNDSRCPKSVTCITAGDATIVLSAGGRAYELHVNGEPKAVTIDGHKVELVRLDPYPQQPGKINSSSYQAVLKVG